MNYTYEEVAGMIDHSLLHPALTDEQLAEGCRLAARYQVASVCVKPYAVRMARRLLRGTGVLVGTVVGFPHGSNSVDSKRYEAEIACRDGATEIDMVVNVGKVLSGDWAYVRKDIKAVVDTAHRMGSIVKVIFETDFLKDDKTKVELCRVCDRLGAEFIKTSTGYSFIKGPDGKYYYKGATEKDLKLMKKHVSPKVKVKASGGVRDLDTLLRCRALGAERVGATETKAILEEYLKRSRKKSGGT